MTDSITEIMKPDGSLLFANGSPPQRKHETGVKESYLFRQADPREKVRKGLMKSMGAEYKTNASQAEFLQMKCRFRYIYLLITGLKRLIT